MSSTRLRSPSSPDRGTVFRRVLYVFFVLLMSNLGAMVDLAHYPEIPYFAEEHLIVGGITAITMILWLVALEMYLTRRKKTEEALRSGSDALQALVNSSPLAIVTFDKDGHIGMWNPAAERMFGWRAEEVMGRPHPIVPEDKQEEFREFREIALGGGAFTGRELQRLRKDGSYIDISVSTAPMRDATGSIVSVMSIITDITDRRLAEEELRAGRERLRVILESTHDGILAVDASGKPIFMNGRFTELWRIPRSLADTGDDDAMLDFVLGQLVDPDGFLRKVKQLYRIADIDNDIILFKDGRIFERYSMPMTDKGSVVGRLWSFRDITDRKRAEEALRESEIRYRSIFDFGADGIVILDPETATPIDFNQQACAQLGYTREEFARLKISDIDALEDHEVVKAHVRKVMTDGYDEFETVHCTKHGERRNVHVKAQYISVAGKSVYYCIWRDITERRKAEEEKQALERQVHQAQKMESLGVLAGGIAHDFNNLLMVVLGHAELALNEISPMSPARESLTEIRAAAQRAADLSRQMLTYTGKALFALERVDMRELVEETAHLLRAAISKKAVLNLNLESGLPPIEGDPSQIRQIVMNLLINASEAIGDRSGAITVSVGATRRDKEYLQKTELHNGLAPGLYVHLEVTDTGSGMDAQTRSRIFEPFFSTKFTGRGLGLAAVLGIVRAHKGAIKVYSEPGKGTTFKVLFPALTDEEDAARSPDSSSLADWRGKGTILLVDDEESLLALGARMLEHLGFTVLTASDGQQAVELYRERGKEIELVLMDLTMPRMDGAAAFGELRRLDPYVRVVLASGYSEEDVLSRFEGRKPAGIVQKPYTLDKLRETLAGLLPA